MDERGESARQALVAALLLGPSTLRDLSRAVSLSEKEVAAHLPHIDKSAKRSGLRFVVEPARCHRCDYVFGERTRTTTPSRCPSCKNERIGAARFSLAPR